MTGATSSGRALAWRQLLRVGNVFTAVSNVIAGYLIVSGDWRPVAPLVVLAAASALLYEAGMVLNDAFDADVDAVERPERPIPSGRISRNTALGVGWILFGGGIGCAALAVWLSWTAAPFLVAACLAVMIVMYDGGFKNMWAGPLAMGWCRTLNVLLGGSLVRGWETWFALGLYAAAVGVYTIGLTLVARREAGPPTAAARRGEHLVALACAVLFAWPWTQIGRGSSDVGPYLSSVGFFAFMVYAAIAVKRGARSSDATQVRSAVKRLLVGFVLIDACAATAAAGVLSGLAVLALVAPTLIAARRAPMT